MVLNRLSIGRRLMLLLVIVMCGFVALTGMSLYQVRAQLESAKGDKTRSLVEAAVSIAAEFHTRQQRGELSETEAQQGALSVLRGLRYEGQNYVWVNDMTPTMVMHPIKSALDGKSLAASRDPNGVPLFLRMVETVRADGAGYVAYHWPRPGSDAPVPKVSYVKGFEPWGWIVGTGVYVDDVDSAFLATAAEEGGITLLVLGLLTALAVWVQRSITQPLRGAAAAMQEIARGDGDLTRRLPEEGHNELTDLARCFNHFAAKIEQTVRQVRDVAGDLAAASTQLATTSRSSSESIDQQSSETQQVATAMTEMTATVQEIATSAEGATAAARDADGHARDGRQRVSDVQVAIGALVTGVDNAAEVVGRLNSKSEAIGGVLDVIRGIAEQTNLLALNAAIEAARAGEQGRGFAVVADEVRTLASRTQDSTSEIQTMIEYLQAGSGEAVQAIENSRASGAATTEKAQQAGASLESIVDTVGTILDRNAQVASAAEQQAVAAQQIDRSIVAISEVAGQSAASADQTSLAAEELARLGATLRELVQQFRLSSTVSG